MRLRLEATPQELWAKGPKLIEELSSALAPMNPDLSEALEKALPEKEFVLKYPVLRDLRDLTTSEYERTVKRMLGAIGEVLKQALTGPSQAPMAKAFGMDPPPRDEPEPGEEADEKPEPGEIDPSTGDLVPEPEEEEEGEEEEPEEKALPNSEPLAYDFTEAIAKKDERTLARVKSALINRGFREADFAEGGAFFGWSNNQLIDFLREQKEPS